MRSHHNIKTVASPHTQYFLNNSNQNNNTSKPLKIILKSFSHQSILFHNVIYRKLNLYHIFKRSESPTLLLFLSFDFIKGKNFSGGFTSGAWESHGYDAKRFQRVAERCKSLYEGENIFIIASSSHGGLFGRDYVIT